MTLTFEHNEEQSPGFFAIVTGLDSALFQACSAGNVENGWPKLSEQRKSLVPQTQCVSALDTYIISSGSAADEVPMVLYVPDLRRSGAE